jgi:hypothetical protein
MCEEETIGCVIVLIGVVAPSYVHSLKIKIVILSCLSNAREFLSATGKLWNVKEVNTKL